MTYICIWDTKRLKIKDNGLVNRPNSFCDGNIRVSYISIKFTPFECQIFQVSIWYVWTLRDFKFKVPGGGWGGFRANSIILSLPPKQIQLSFRNLHLEKNPSALHSILSYDLLLLGEYSDGRSVPAFTQNSGNWRIYTRWIGRDRRRIRGQRETADKKYVWHTPPLAVAARRPGTIGRNSSDEHEDQTSSALRYSLTASRGKS